MSYVENWQALLRKKVEEAIRLARNCSMESSIPDWIFTEKQIIAMCNVERPKWIRLNDEIYPEPVVRRVREWHMDTPMVSAVNPNGTLSFSTRLMVRPSDWKPCEPPKAYRPGRRKSKS
jgi:hypothetical protein